MADYRWLVFFMLYSFSLHIYFMGAVSDDFDASRLIPDEKSLLLRILPQRSRTCGWSDLTWNFSNDPCGGTYGWRGIRCQEFDGGMLRIVSLSLSSSAITTNNSLPIEISRLQKLETLELHGQNQANECLIRGPFPAWISGMPNLRTVNLSGNKISIVPRDIGFMERLTTLDLHSNEIQEIPATWANLKALQFLNLSDNKIRVFPASIRGQIGLNTLDLSSNQIHGCPPDWLSDLPNLTNYLLQDNHFSSPALCSQLANRRYLSASNDFQSPSSDNGPMAYVYIFVGILVATMLILCVTGLNTWNCSAVMRCCRRGAWRAGPPERQTREEEEGSPVESGSSLRLRDGYSVVDNRTQVVRIGTPLRVMGSGQVAETGGEDPPPLYQNHDKYVPVYFGGTLISVAEVEDAQFAGTEFEVNSFGSGGIGRKLP